MSGILTIFVQQKEMDFPKIIISWYLAHKRDLPWRNTADPYTIWLSEIILQQTRVEQGMPYFLKFRDKYPTLKDFSEASEDEILKLWQGLGYYSRARNMMQAAREVMLWHKGIFPQTFSELLKLKGIGSYTAAAIASFACNEAVAVVDGNVYRLLARYFGIDVPVNSSKGKKLFEELAASLIPHDHPGLYNQAVMEFGSLACRPVAPLCGTCPLAAGCTAYASEKVKELPVKTPKKKSKERYFNYLVISLDESVYIHKREGSDIWKGLFDFPLIESEHPLEEQDLLEHPVLKTWLGANSFVLNSVVRQYRHILSHQVLHARFWKIKIRNENTGFFPDFFMRVGEEDINSYAMPRLSARYLEEEFINL